MIAKGDVAGQQANAKRKQKLLDAGDDGRQAIERLYSLHMEMLASGWQDIMCAPRDGTEIEVVELGSTGIHKATWFKFDHDSPLDNCGSFFVDGNWPSRPSYWRPIRQKSKP